MHICCTQVWDERWNPENRWNMVPSRTDRLWTAVSIQGATFCLLKQTFIMFTVARFIINSFQFAFNFNHGCEKGAATQRACDYWGRPSSVQLLKAGTIISTFDHLVCNVKKICIKASTPKVTTKFENFGGKSIWLVFFFFLTASGQLACVHLLAEHNRTWSSNSKSLQSQNVHTKRWGGEIQINSLAKDVFGVLLLWWFAVFSVSVQ